MGKFEELKDTENYKKAVSGIKALFELVGENSSREGLKRTPERFLKACINEWFGGYDKDPEQFSTQFLDGAENYNDMVLVKNIKVQSHCEHHLAPIVGVAHVAYIPSRTIIGLSKINRIVDLYSRRLQVQERLTGQIAKAIDSILHPKGVAVLVVADHFCIKTRGIGDEQSITETAKLLGVFETDLVWQEKFFRAVK